MRRFLVVSLVIFGVAACAPAPSPTSSASSAVAPTSQGPKRVVIAMAGDPPGISTHINPAGTATPGLPELLGLVAPGVSVVDGEGQRTPLLASEIPSTERGSWLVFPDGRMQTTWKLRPGITWHDGHPFTSADLVFAATVGRDPELSEFGDVAFTGVERVEAPDPLTVTVYWKRPYTDADAMFAPGPEANSGYAEPMPFHILGPLYSEDKNRVRESAYWTTEFVGHGAFQLREFLPGSMLRLAAYDQYVLGRPKIDEIEVRFITSTPTLVANVLAGEVEMTIGRGLSLEQGLAIRDQWHEGSVAVGVIPNWIPIYPQLLDPT